MSIPIRRLWYSLWIVTAFCLLFPMRFTLLKVGLLVGSVGLWAMSLYLYGRFCWARVVCGLVAVAVCVILLLPARTVDQDGLRRAYVRSLLSYEGTYYVWGGGNRLGIDCSGLVQRGLIDAQLWQGLKTQNGALVRGGIDLWWHNRSARALGEGYRNETRLLREVTSLNGSDDDGLLPGDIAVLSDGVHVLAYVGDKTWIEADPAPMHVVLARAPGNRDIYFNSPVRLMRWRVLEAA